MKQATNNKGKKRKFIQVTDDIWQQFKIQAMKENKTVSDWMIQAGCEKLARSPDR